MRRASRGTSASLLNCMICKIYSKNLIDMKLASYLNSTNVTEISTVFIFYSFSPINFINFLLHSYSPHNLPTIFNSCVPYILRTTIRNNTCKYLSILFFLQSELHLLSSYFSFYNIHVNMF